MQKLFRSNFFIKLKSWEYWPFGIIQAPIIILWLWYAIKERSLLYFSASNPSILSGGMMGESKYEILQNVSDSIKPRTFLVRLPSTRQEVVDHLKKNGFSFPVIFKPDLGERGWMVRKIKNEADIENYLSEIKIDFIVQELVALPLEFGVFYVRFPSQATGFVNSINGKEFLSITGDGEKTIQELILEKIARNFSGKAKDNLQNRLKEILPKGERLELVSIGNHCLGTTFLNKNNLITEKLSGTYDQISKQIPDFYFGRFDLRCNSAQDLESGKIMILEVNGCGAEPAHIYQPGASLFEGIRVLITHWQNLYRISKENHERGVAYLTLREGRQIYRRVKSLTSGA
ncbi:MAG: hypothetical protein HC819_24800 [Cyclobacteriaceae bacterium]|nr:hypothetical protein [Cyclobacteriaceae bacterium]